MADHTQDGTGSDPDAPKPKRRRRAPTNWTPIVALAVVAAVGTGAAGAEPTGIAFFDVVESAAFGAILTIFAACSRRWVWLILAGVATVLAGSFWVFLFGAVALGLAVEAAWRSNRRDRLTGALIGALSAQALLRTADVGFFGLTAIITGLVTVTVMISGFRTMRRRNRKRILIGIGAIAGFCIVSGALFAFFASSAVDPLEQGISAARKGMDEATRADQSGAGAQWRSAESSFARAEQSLSNPLARLVYPVPIASQHARMVTNAARSGRTVTANAAEAATVAPYQKIRAADGRFDLDQIVSMEVPVARTATSMVAARDQVIADTNSWLAGPMRDRIDEYSDRLVRAVPQVERVLGALRAAPEVLGGDGPRHYLLLFANTAESRGLGGFIGAWAQLDAVDGKLELSGHGKMGDLNDASDPATRKIIGEDEYLSRYGFLQPARYLQNVSASPDFPTVARVAEQLYEQTRGVAVDGVMYVDPFALAALLELTGEVEVDGIPEPITSENAAAFLMHDQYTDLPDVDERSDRLSDVAEATFDALTSRELPEISQVTHVLSPMMHQGRLLAYVNAPETNTYFESIGLTGGFPTVDGDDLLSIRLSNGSANKADFFLRPTYDYVVHRDADTGATKGTVSGVLTNVAPSSGEPNYVLGNRFIRTDRAEGHPFGSIDLQFSVYSALRPVAMKVDGRPVGIQVQKELGAWVATQTITIGPGDKGAFELELEGTLDPGGPYRLTYVPQPGAYRTPTTIEVERADGSGMRTIDAEGRKPETFTVR